MYVEVSKSIQFVVVEDLESWSFFFFLFPGAEITFSSDLETGEEVASKE